MVETITPKHKSRAKPQSAWPYRSPLEWSVRCALLVVVVVLGYFSVTFSIAQVVTKKDPGLAHRLAPYSGRITADYALTFAGPGASSADRTRADELARLAMRQDPSAISALSTLGLDAAVRGDTAGARRIFAKAQRLSRRDLRTQLWSIEDAVAREDIPGALRWYDIALRTNPDLSEVLFPVLVSAGEDPAIRPALIRMLASKPIWNEAFIKFAAGNGPDPRQTAALFQSLRRLRVPIPQNAQAGVIDALARKNYYDQAWAYYASLRHGAVKYRSRDPRFSAELEQPTQFDWIAVNSGDVSTSARDGAFHFTVPASVGGLLLWQKQLLAPGRYWLTGHGNGLLEAEGARPYWTLACENGKELGRIQLPSGNRDGVFSGAFDVPPECPVQTLMLVAPPSDAVSGLSGDIDRAELVRVR